MSFRVLKTQIRLLILATVLGTTSIARADFGMGMFNAANSAGINIAGTAAVNASISRSAKKRKTTRKNYQQPKLTLNPATLKYQVSPAVSTRLKDRFWNILKQKNPQSAQEIDMTLRHQDLVGQFKSNIAPYGLRINHVGDNFTAYWVVMWMIANQESIPSVAKVKAAQTQIGSAILNNNAIAREEDAKQQLIGETLIYKTAFALGMRDKIIQSGNTAKIQELSDAAYNNMLKQGIDLRSLKLTSIGFIPK